MGILKRQFWWLDDRRSRAVPYYATRGKREVRSAREELGELAARTSDRSSGMVGRSLAAVREHLGMDVAFVAEFSEDRLEFRSLEGDAESFGFEEGGNERILDARGDGLVKGLEITSEADIGSYDGATEESTARSAA